MELPFVYFKLEHIISGIMSANVVLHFAGWNGLHIRNRIHNAFFSPYRFSCFMAIWFMMQLRLYKRSQEAW